MSWLLLAVLLALRPLEIPSHFMPADVNLLENPK